MAGEAVERGSVAELYVAYAPDGIHLAFLLTGDRALAENLVQDAFVRSRGGRRARTIARYRPVPDATGHVGVLDRLRT